MHRIFCIEENLVFSREYLHLYKYTLNAVMPHDKTPLIKTVLIASEEVMLALNNKRNISERVSMLSYIQQHTNVLRL